MLTDKTIFHVAIFLISFFIITSFAHTTEFREEKSHHFVVYYYEGIPEEFADKTLEYCERYYREITDRLGYNRFDFWTWDDRAIVYIYPDKETYLKEVRQAKWSGGAASPIEKTIWAFPHMAGFFDSLLPHEIGHIIFREVIGPRARVPLWLEEGVACYQEEARRFGASGIASKAIRENKFIPLDKLSQIDVRRLENREEVNLFYIEAVSVIDFLITKYGRSSFAEFCRELRSGKSFDTALHYAFDIRDLNELNDLWVEYIEF